MWQKTLSLKFVLESVAEKKQADLEQHCERDQVSRIQSTWQR